jgi:hypothetical protein
VTEHRVQPVMSAQPYVPVFGGYGVGQKQGRVGLFCPRYLQHISENGSVAMLVFQHLGQWWTSPERR